MICIACAGIVFAGAGQATSGQRRMKDPGEYSIFDSVKKQTDPHERLALLIAWKEQYPDSDYKLERLHYFLMAYADLHQAPKVIDTAKEMLALDPRDRVALYWISTLTPQSGDTSPDALDLGEKAANGLLVSERPAGIENEAWTRAMAKTDALAYRALGWVAMQRKNWDAAEQNFKKSLNLNPNDALVSYWLANMLIDEKKQGEALWHFARATALEGEGALSPDRRNTLDQYLTKVFTALHGDTSGLAELKEQAKASALPPAGFQIQAATKGKNASGAKSEYDLGETKWGMSKEQVITSEGMPSAESGDKFLYAAIVFGSKVTKYFDFIDGKLVRAAYMLDETFAEPNQYIVQGNIWVKALKETYGEPTVLDEWLNDQIRKDESYGLAVSAGHLKIHDRWETERTIIDYMLTGNDSKVTTALVYTGKKFLAEIEQREQRRRGVF
jgi:tetratricopeptide (TPR) repeat protein